MNHNKDDLRPEYSEDLIKSGKRGAYQKQYHAESNIVVIDPDLSNDFPNTQAVNRALRQYLASQNQS